MLIYDYSDEDDFSGTVIFDSEEMAKSWAASFPERTMVLNQKKTKQFKDNLNKLRRT